MTSLWAKEWRLCLGTFIWVLSFPAVFEWGGTWPWEDLSRKEQKMMNWMSNFPGSPLSHADPMSPFSRVCFSSISLALVTHCKGYWVSVTHQSCSSVQKVGCLGQCTTPTPPLLKEKVDCGWLCWWSFPSQHFLGSPEPSQLPKAT